MREVKAELKKASWPWIPKGKGEKGFKRFKELQILRLLCL